MTRLKPAFAALPLVGAVALLASLPGGWLHRGPWLAAWLAAWSFFLDLALGALAVLWMHTLTGGAWGEAIRAPLLCASRLLPWLALLFLPILAQLPALYGWTALRSSWADHLAAPGFKQTWLQVGFFQARAVALLLLWNLLAWLARQPRWERSRAFAAAALIIYAFSASVAAMDWTLSLHPFWYSSSYGMLALQGQAVTGLAWAVLLICAHPGTGFNPRLGRDLGNLLMLAVIGWAYLAFTQYLIIWAENLPHEIAWYVARRTSSWIGLGMGAAVLGFAVAGPALLWRRVKESPKRLAMVAVMLLAARLLDRWYTVLPTVAPEELPSLLWLAPLLAFGLLAVLGSLVWRLSLRELVRA